MNKNSYDLIDAWNNNPGITMEQMLEEIAALPLEQQERLRHILWRRHQAGKTGSQVNWPGKVHLGHGK